MTFKTDAAWMCSVKQGVLRKYRKLRRKTPVLEPKGLQLH